MSNTAWVHSKVPLTLDGVRDDLKTVFDKKGYAEYVDVVTGDFDSVTIEFKTAKTPATFTFWLKDDETLEFSWGETRGRYADFMSWMMSFVQNELALMYDGHITDEGLGDDEIIEPVVDKLNSYNEYKKMRTSHMSTGSKILMTILDFFDEQDIFAGK